MALPRVIERLKRRAARLPMLGLWLLAAAVVATMSRGRVVARHVARGYAEPLELSVGPVESGRLVEVLPVLGQTVRLGDVVARLDPAYVDSELAEARAALAQKRAQVLAQREALGAELARSGLQGVQARAAEAQDRAELKELDVRVERLAGLVAQQLASRSEYEEALRQRAAVRARVSAYDGALSAAPRDGGARIAVAEALELRLMPFSLAVDEGEAAVKRLELRKQALALTSPCDCAVAYVAHRPGEVIAGGAEVLRLVAPALGRVLAFVPDRSNLEVRVGQKVAVERPSTFESAHDATVVELGGEVELMPQRLWLAPQVPMFGRKLVVKLDDGAQALLPGEAFDVRL